MFDFAFVSLRVLQPALQCLKPLFTVPLVISWLPPFPIPRNNCNCFAICRKAVLPLRVFDSTEKVIKPFRWPLAPTACPVILDHKRKVVADLL
jgi:hypothetical protein